MCISRASIFLFSFSLPPWPLFSCTPILRARSHFPDFLSLCTFRSPHASFRLRVYFALRAHRFSPTRSHPSHAPSPIRTLHLPHAPFCFRTHFVSACAPSLPHPHCSCALPSFGLFSRLRVPPAKQKRSPYAAPPLAFFHLNPVHTARSFPGSRPPPR